jgi:hypothetical protein
MPWDDVLYREKSSVRLSLKLAISSAVVSHRDMVICTFLEERTSRSHCCKIEADQSAISLTGAGSEPFLQLTQLDVDETADGRRLVTI